MKESSTGKIWGKGRRNSTPPLRPSTLLPVASCFISDSDASVAAARTLSPPRRTLSSPIKAITLSSWRDNSRMESQKRLRSRQRIPGRFYNSPFTFEPCKTILPAVLVTANKISRDLRTYRPLCKLNWKLNEWKNVNNKIFPSNKYFIAYDIDLSIFRTQCAAILEEREIPWNIFICNWTVL